MRLVLTLLLAWPAIVLAAPAASTAVGSRPPTPSDSLLEVVLALALVVAAIFALAWLLRRMQSGAGFSSRGMRVVAMLPLSPRERVVLIEVGERQLLLGVAPGRVSLLQSFDEAVLDSTSAGSGEFGQRLKQALRAGRPS